MTSVGCSHCGNASVEMNKSVAIDGDIVCFPCVDELYQDQSKLAGKSVLHTLDPTVCSFCDKDFGNENLALIGKRPACKDCSVDIRNRTFPLWVKGFLAFVLAAVVFSSIWNFRYYHAWYLLNQSTEAFTNGDLQNAYLNAKQASLRANEVSDLNDIATFYHGILLISKDSSKQALPELEKSAPAIGEYSRYWIEEAKLDLAYKAKDYKSAIESASTLKNIDSTSATNFLVLASAFSCEYAVTGKDSMKTASLQNVEKARKIGFGQGDAGYANLIAYRLETKDPIDRKDFEKKYPKGWTKTN